MKTFYNYFVLLAIAAEFATSGSALGQVPETVLKEAVTLWPLATNSGDPFTDEEHRILALKWKRITEIGEDTMSRALLVFYKEKAGVERSFSFNSSITRSDPDWEPYVFEHDSLEKGLMAGILIDDPRRTAEFLPMLRERMRWLIKHVPDDKPPAAVAVNEVASSAQYMLVRGTAEDKQLVNELRAAYEKLQTPYGAQKVEAIDMNIQDADRSVRYAKEARLPFIAHGVSSNPISSSSGQRATPDKAITTAANEKEHFGRSTLLLLVIATAIGAAWLLLRKRN